MGEPEKEDGFPTLLAFLFLTLLHLPTSFSLLRDDEPLVSVSLKLRAAPSIFTCTRAYDSFWRPLVIQDEFAATKLKAETYRHMEIHLGGLQSRAPI